MTTNFAVEQTSGSYAFHHRDQGHGERSEIPVLLRRGIMSDRSNQIVVTHLHRALEATGLAAVVLCLALAAAAGPGRDIKPKPARALPDKEWLNTPENKPLKLEELRGKVVLVEFWTFACFNSRNTLPYVKAWHEKYNRQGLVIIGVHTPEFERESKLENVQKVVRDLGITYPVALDNDYAAWRRYENRY